MRYRESLRKAKNEDARQEARRFVLANKLDHVVAHWTGKLIIDES
jgi:Zn-dependent peptidase ImmA (M78 family)